MKGHPMKRFLLPFVAVLALTVGLVAESWESRIGTLISTGTTVNQTTTATPFTIPGGNQPLAIQCDAAACVTVGSGSAITASCTAANAAKGVLLAAGQLYDIPMVAVGPNLADTIAVISVSGTANCEVFKVLTP